MEPVAPAAILRHPEAGYVGSKTESAVSGVTWGAVAGGAFVAAAMALILLAFGAGLGLTSVSPWSNVGASATAVGVATVIWLVVMQVISSAMGGYVAGRLRTKWVDVHDNEVYFRDTAHGFLVWAVGLVITAAFLGSAAASLVGAAAEVTGGAAATATVAAAAGAGTAAGSASNGASARGGSAVASDPTGYFVDTLFRGDRPMDAQGTPAAAQSPASPTPGAASGVGLTGTMQAANATDANNTAMGNQGGNSQQRGADSATRAEVGRILVNGLTQDQFPAADRAYLTQVVAARTGMSAADADRRVSQVLANAQQAKVKALEKTDEARKGAAHLAFWTFFAMLCGAFAASYAATIGGRQRDSMALVR